MQLSKSKPFVPEKPRNYSTESIESTKTFVFEFDKFKTGSDEIPSFNPTLSLLLLPRDFSNIKILEGNSQPQVIFNGNWASNLECRNRRRELNLPCFPRIKADHNYFHIKNQRSYDQIINTNRRFISYLSTFILISSLVMLIISLWVEYLMPKTFSWKVLVKGAIENFPVPYALFANSIFGFIAAFSFLFNNCKPNSYKLAFITGANCCVWSMLAMIYSFGANILYEAEMEEIMISEISSVASKHSIYWVNSQTFFECCGINSYHDWEFVDLNVTQGWRNISQSYLYPKSCCGFSLSLKSCQNSAELHLSGCLNPELDMLLGIAYSLFVLAVLHFLFQAFALMIVTRIYIRQRYLRHQTENSILIASKERQLMYNCLWNDPQLQAEVRLECGNFSEKNLSSKFDKYDHLEQFHVKRSSTLVDESFLTPVESELTYHLVKKEDTWTKVLADGSKSETRNSTQGDTCSLCISETPFGKRKWLATTSIQFKYFVEEVSDLLSSSEPYLLITADADDENDKPHPNIDTKSRRRLVFVDQTVYDLYGQQIENYFLKINASATLIPIITNEETKNIDTLINTLKAIDDFIPDRRNEPIIAIGGGVCLDIVGLAATLYRRKTPHIRIPTTLLGLVDASVGAKSGVNFSNGKNKLGAYVPPIAVFLDKSFLRTLPPKHLSNGMGEILKMALMKSSKLFEILEEHGKQLIQCAMQNQQGDYIIAEAVELMLEELTPNLWENDLDRIVDFGHVVSPILEMEVLPTLLHGEAVTIDMALMCYLSNQLGFLTINSVGRIIKCMQNLSLPVHHIKCNNEMIEESLRKRLKHGNGKLRLPIPIEIGKARIISDITTDVIRAAVKDWTENLAR